MLLVIIWLERRVIYNRGKVSGFYLDLVMNRIRSLNRGQETIPQQKPLVQRWWNWACVKRLAESLKHSPIHKILPLVHRLPMLRRSMKHRCSSELYSEIQPLILSRHGRLMSTNQSITSPFPSARGASSCVLCSAWDTNSCRLLYSSLLVSTNH